MMRLYVLLLTAFIAVGPGRTGHYEGANDLSSLLSKGLYEKMFPHHHPLYTYEAFIKAAAGFPEIHAVSGKNSAYTQEWTLSRHESRFTGKRRSVKAPGVNTEFA